MNKGVHSDSACISSDRRFIMTGLSPKACSSAFAGWFVRMNRTLPGRSVTAPQASEEPRDGRSDVGRLRNPGLELRT
jgi:hypothetical protein